MASFTDYLEKAVLDHVLGTAAMPAPAAVYVGLFSSAPGEADGGTETAGNGYARQAAAFDPAAGGATANAADITFTAAGGPWADVVAVGIFDAAVGGNLLAYTAIPAAVVGDGDSVVFAAGAIDVTLD